MAKSSRFLYFSILFGCLALGIIIRASNYPFVFANLTGHLNFIDTDCYYQLRRLVYFLEHFPQPLIFDPLNDWPKGAFVDWPEGFLIALGVPLKLFGVDNFRTLEFGSCLLMVFYGMLTSSMIFIAGRKVLADSSHRMLIMLLACTNFLLIRFSCLGQVDHHIFEALFPPVIFWMSLRIFHEKSVSSRRWSIGLGLLLAFSLSVSSSSMFTIAMFFALYGLVLGNRQTVTAFAFVNVGFYALLLPYVFWSVGARHQFFSMHHPSFFHLFIVGSFSIFAGVLSVYRRQGAWMIMTFVGIFSAMYVLNWPPRLSEPFKSAMGYVFGRDGILGNVQEAAPIFRTYDQFSTQFMHLNFGYTVYLLPLAFVMSALWWKKADRVPERALFLGLSILAIPGISQKRFSHLMMGLYLIFVVWLLVKFQNWLRRQDFRPVHIFTFVLLAAFYIPNLYYGFAPSTGARDRIDLGSTRLFLKAAPVDPKLAWKRLALIEPPSTGFWANPNMGHLLQYHTGLGAVTNSFYHRASFDKDFELRQIETFEDLKAFLKENKIEYLFSVDDWRFFEMQYRIRGLDTGEFMKTENIQGEVRTIFEIPVLERFAWARLVTNEDGPPFLKRLFQVRFQENHFYTYVRSYHFKE